VSANQEHYPGVTKATLRGGLIESLERIRPEVEASYRGHHQYDWVRPRQTWLDAKCPVYIDFGDEWLARLEVYDETELRCIRLVAKQKFVRDVMTETRGLDIATRFYPISSD
jgi:competence protein CoiA